MRRTTRVRSTLAVLAGCAALAAGLHLLSRTFGEGSDLAPGPGAGGEAGGPSVTLEGPGVVEDAGPRARASLDGGQEPKAGLATDARADPADLCLTIEVVGRIVLGESQGLLVPDWSLARVMLEPVSIPNTDAAWDARHVIEDDGSLRAWLEMRPGPGLSSGWDCANQRLAFRNIRVPVRLRIEHPRLVPFEVDLPPGEWASSSEPEPLWTLLDAGTITMEARDVLYGRVHLAAEASPAGPIEVRVYACDAEQVPTVLPFGGTTAYPDGRYWLPRPEALRVLVVAVSAGHRPGALPVRLEEGALEQELPPIHLDRGVAIAGTVALSREWRPPARIFLRLRREERWEHLILGVELLGWNGVTAEWIRQEADLGPEGSFRFDQLAPLCYRLNVEVPGERILSKQDEHALDVCAPAADLELRDAIESVVELVWSFAISELSPGEDPRTPTEFQVTVHSGGEQGSRAVRSPPRRGAKSSVVMPPQANFSVEGLRDSQVVWSVQGRAGDAGTVTEFRIDAGPDWPGVEPTVVELVWDFALSELSSAEDARSPIPTEFQVTVYSGFLKESRRVPGPAYRGARDAVEMHPRTTFSVEGLRDSKVVRIIYGRSGEAGKVTEYRIDADFGQK